MLKIALALLCLANLTAGVRVPVWTSSGEVIQADELVATLDGQRTEIVRVLGPDDDLMVLLIWDLVGDISEIDMARAGLLKSVAAAPDNVHYSVLRAQDGLKVLAGPSVGRERVLQEIENASVTGTPGLLETIEGASDLADSVIQKAAVRVAVFYVTDSEIDEYREDFTNPVVNRSDRGDMSRRFPEGMVRDRIVRLDGKLAKIQAPIFVVHLEYETGRIDEAYQNGLLQLTATTGGDALFCRSNAEIPGAIDSMMQRAISHHSVEVAMPTGRETVELSLEWEAGELKYRSRYKLTD
jgi:hypothetical protein